VGAEPDAPSRTESSGQERSPIERVLRMAHVDFPADAGRPRPVWFVLACVVAVAGSLLADRALVAIGTSVFPGIKGYGHFRFSDYGKLTVIGVTVACVAWPVVTAISSRPRWLFLRLAILVTMALWLPDLWILLKGQPARAVGVLVVMHLAIALVTYNALVRLAPARGRT
jgi:hypothetical protein